MSKRAAAALLGLLLAGCSQSQSSSVTLDADELKAFTDWKTFEQDDYEPEPFKATPVSVKGTGVVRASPDIAVVTGLIKTQADTDRMAMDEAAQIINNVQDLIAGKNVDISFTTLSTVEKRDEKCLSGNRAARFRQQQIDNDNRFNLRQLQIDADKRQKLRENKPRIAERLCPVTNVETYLEFTAWIRPSFEVSDYITAFTAAGVENVDLFGFDFSDYDALYREASEKAVTNAREKAELIASRAGTKLTTIERFRITGTERRKRYGQQAMLISPHGSRTTTPQQRTSFSDRTIRAQKRARAQAERKAASKRARRGAQSPAYITCPDGSLVSDINSCPVRYSSAVSGYSSAVSGGPIDMFETGDNSSGTTTGFDDTVVVQKPQSESNALRESMMSGSKVIRVTATLAYNYETPLDGVIFKTPEDE